MIKLLIVDDEDFEIHGLLTMIRSFDLPVEICATARNGRDGLEKARQFEPDIILSDLRMPQMDGMEMQRQLHALGIKAQFVMISGFEDFEAAREGLELGMTAYLLKPVSRDELSRVLAKCCVACAGNVPNLQSSPHSPTPSYYTLEEEQFVRSLLFASEKRIEALLSCEAAAKVFPEKVIYVVAVVELPPTADSDIFACSLLLQRFAKEQNSPAPVPLDNLRAAIILNAPAFVSESDFIDHLTRKTEQLLTSLASLSAGDAHVGISDIGSDLSALPLYYKQSLTALEQRFHNSMSCILFYEDKSSAQDASGQRKHQVIARIQSILEQEYMLPFSIDALAERLFLSPSHVRRLFKNMTGVTIMDCLENLRLDQSLRLLAQPKYKIHEIGCMVGYENPSYFNALFKRFYGITPGDYRNSLNL